MFLSNILSICSLKCYFWGWHWVTECQPQKNTFLDINHSTFLINIEVAYLENTNQALKYWYSSRCWFEVALKKDCKTGHINLNIAQIWKLRLRFGLRHKDTCFPKIWSPKYEKHGKYWGLHKMTTFQLLSKCHISLNAIKCASTHTHCVQLDASIEPKNDILLCLEAEISSFIC